MAMLVKFTRFRTCLLAPHQYISHSYKKEFIVALLSELSPKEGPPYVRSVLPFCGPGSNINFSRLAAMCVHDKHVQDLVDSTSELLLHCFFASARIMIEPT